jgi:hypothetical protein
VEPASCCWPGLRRVNPVDIEKWRRPVAWDFSAEPDLRRKPDWIKQFVGACRLSIDTADTLPKPLSAASVSKAMLAAGLVISGSAMLPSARATIDIAINGRYSATSLGNWAKTNAGWMRPRQIHHHDGRQRASAPSEM